MVGQHNKKTNQENKQVVLSVRLSLCSRLYIRLASGASRGSRRWWASVVPPLGLSVSHISPQGDGVRGVMTRFWPCQR